MPVQPRLYTCADWTVEKSAEADPLFTFRLKRRIVHNEDGTFGLPRKTEAPALVVRDRFFAISTPDEACRFFQEFGPYFVNELLGDKALTIRFSVLKKKRDGYREALLNGTYWAGPPDYLHDDLDPEDWDWFMRRPLNAELIRVGGLAPAAVVPICKDVAACIRSAVYLDSLCGNKRARCANPSCPRTPIFLVTRSNKRFCSPTCEQTTKKRTQRKNKPTRKTNKNSKAKNIKRR
jgi:hypothetical protein